jgi:branched-chain amino acid transport system substrate-binding protein
MTEAMTRAGRELTRAGLLDALEGFYNVQTSLAAPISFGPNRRVGTSAVRIMVFDPEARKLIPVQDGSM